MDGIWDPSLRFLVGDGVHPIIEFAGAVHTGNNTPYAHFGPWQLGQLLGQEENFEC